MMEFRNCRKNEEFLAVFQVLFFGCFGLVGENARKQDLHLRISGAGEDGMWSHIQSHPLTIIEGNYVY